MTRTKNDVPQLFYFYKLVCNDTNVKEFYVGSTVNWRDRKSNHKQSCTNSKHPSYNETKYKTIRANGGWSNWSMIEIERGIYIRRMAEAREYELMAELHSTMNKQKCFGAMSKCDHGIRKQKCKTCKGTSICQHNKYKEICKTCKGSSVCQHNKLKQYCKICDGSQICEHDYINKKQCPYCNPYLCECGEWTVESNKNQHFRSAKCKAFHMATYGKVFI